MRTGVSRSKCKVRKFGSDCHVWDTECLEGQSADCYLDWNLDWCFCEDVKSYGIIFAISVFCFSIIGYLSVFILLTTTVSDCRFDLPKLFCSVLISELILTLHHFL